MEKQRALDALSALSTADRLGVVRARGRSCDGAVAALMADGADVRQNVMSGNARIPARAGLVVRSAEAESTHPAFGPDALRELPAADRRAGGRRVTILFLGAGNSARSIMAEAIVNHDYRGRFRAFSAGSLHEGRLNPDAVAVLAILGYPTAGLHSKSWAGLAAPDGPAMDFVFTLCDAVSEGPRPVWSGNPLLARWAIPDPRRVTGGAKAERFAHVNAFRMIERRITALAGLPFANLGRAALQARLDEIGAIDDHPGRRG